MTKPQASINPVWATKQRAVNNPAAGHHGPIRVDRRRCVRVGVVPDRRFPLEGKPAGFGGCRRTGPPAATTACLGRGVFKIRLVVGSARCTVSVVGSREDATVLSAVNCGGCSIGVATGRGTAVGGTRVDVDRMVGGTLSVTTILRVGCGPEHPTANAAKDNVNTENASFPVDAQTYTPGTLAAYIWRAYWEKKAIRWAIIASAHGNLRIC